MKRQTRKNFLELNPEYNLKYSELQKEIRIWNNSGQYWLAKEADRRAKCLLNGNIDDYNKQTHSHDLAYPYVLNKFP